MKSFAKQLIKEYKSRGQKEMFYHCAEALTVLFLFVFAYLYFSIAI